MDNELSQQSEYILGNYLWKVVPPIFLVFGTLGNLLTITVLLQYKNRFFSTSLYLSALAISDLLSLWTGLLRQWIKYTFNEDIRWKSLASCKIHLFTVYLSLYCTSWMLVIVTVERFYGVWKPHKVKRTCTFRLSVVVIVIAVSCLAVLNAHFFFGERDRRCSPVTAEYKYFINTVWPWVDMCVFSLAPLTILLFTNMFIIIKVVHTSRKARTQIAPHMAPARPSHVDKSSQLTKMLLTVNFVFFLCSAPVVIYIIGYEFWIQPYNTTDVLASSQLWWAITNLLMYLNNTINFVLYFLSGSRFRADVLALFRKLRRRTQDATITHFHENDSHHDNDTHNIFSSRH